MDIHQLKAFSLVFKHKSFTKASEDLNVKQPTISNHIKSLENELKCKLFDRLGRSVIPTIEAESLYPHSQDLLEKVDVLKEAISEVKHALAGKLIVGASTIPGVYLLPRILCNFQKQYQSISHQIMISDSMEVVENISRHELLLGIVGAKLPNEQIRYIPFIEDELIAVSSPALIENNRMTLKEFIKHPMIKREEGSGTLKETEKYLKGKGVSIDDIKIAGIFGSTDAVKQAVKAGLGVSILSKFSVADELKHKSLVQIELDDIHMKRQFYVVTHKKRTLPKLYDAFFHHLLHKAK
jgi:DNA-binding transcriptional LysR family regulator